MIKYWISRRVRITIGSISLIISSFSLINCQRISTLKIIIDTTGNIQEASIICIHSLGSFKKIDKLHAVLTHGLGKYK